MTNGVLGYLHYYRVAALEGVFDAAGLAFQPGGVPVNFTGVKHGVAALAQVNESSFHGGQHVLYAPNVDIAHH